MPYSVVTAQRACSTEMVNHLMYADDLVLLSPSATGLRELLCACEEFSISHDVYNSKKSSVLICRNKAMDHAAPPVFTVNGSIIGESDKVKYLGHIICNDMSDDDDMMRQRRQLYAQGNVLSRRFHMCSLEVKNVLFRTFALPCTPVSYGLDTLPAVYISCMLRTTMRLG